MTRHIKLSVNDRPIDMDYFVQAFLDHTIYGMISSLEGVKEVRDVKIDILGVDTNLLVNGHTVDLNRFVATLMCNTLRGMVMSLKGVDTIDKIQIAIER